MNEDTSVIMKIGDVVKIINFYDNAINGKKGTVVSFETDPPFHCAIKLFEKVYSLDPLSWTNSINHVIIPLHNLEVIK